MYVSMFLDKFKFNFPVKIFSYSKIDATKKNENYDLFNTKMPGVVKIIVSTNIFESGVNIENLYTVIDTGIRGT